MSYLRSHWRLFLLSLGFLTRLAPALNATDDEMGAACLYYPITGALLGSLITLPLWLGSSVDPWIQAWGYAGLSLWITRALHHDGLADVIDALGSGKTGDGFRAVLKDSRIGAFGTVGLIMILLGQVVCAAACLKQGLLAPLLYAPLFARSLPVFFALTAPVSPFASLGRIFAAAPLKKAATVSCVSIFLGALMLMEAAPAICCLVLASILIVFFAAKARRHGGYNGDFFGALIVCGEIAVLFSACLLSLPK